MSKDVNVKDGSDSHEFVAQKNFSENDYGPNIDLGHCSQSQQHLKCPWPINDGTNSSL